MKSDVLGNFLRVRTKHFIFQAIVNWKTQNNKLCPCIIDVRLQDEMLVQGVSILIIVYTLQKTVYNLKGILKFGTKPNWANQHMSERDTAHCGF